MSKASVGLSRGSSLRSLAERVDLGFWPVGEVGDGALADALAFAPAFTQQDGGRGVAVGDDFHVHGNYPSILMQRITTVI